MLVPITAACILQAAAAYGLPPALLYTVLQVEGGSVGKVSQNSNATVDIGPMQINTVRLPEIARATGADPARLAQALRDDGCYNVTVGAYLLADEIRKANGDVWRGVGNYHSRTPHYHQRYQVRVYKKALELFTPNAKGGAR